VITSYATLQSEAASWLNRDDLTDQIKTFAQMFEAKANRILRVQSMIQTASDTAVAESFVAPEDLLATDLLHVDAARVPFLDYISPREYFENKVAGITGPTRFYTIIGGTFRLQPAPTSFAYELLYFAKIAALSDANTTNWLLMKSPDLYLYGTLAEAELVIRR